MSSSVPEAATRFCRTVRRITARRPSKTKKGLQRVFSQGLPDLDDFVDDHGRKAYRKPNADGLDWHPRPGADGEPEHRLRPVAPPAIRDSQRDFPQEADQQDEKERKA